MAERKIKNRGLSKAVLEWMSEHPGIHHANQVRDALHADGYHIAANPSSPGRNPVTAALAALANSDAPIERTGYCRYQYTGGTTPPASRRKAKPTKRTAAGTQPALPALNRIGKTDAGLDLFMGEDGKIYTGVIELFQS